MLNGWPSPSTLLLASDKSPLPTGRISIDEKSWITSLKPVGFIAAITIHGIIANRFGRKWPLVMISIPIVVSWILIYYAQNIHYIYIARFIHGASTAGIFSLCQLYFVEISSDR